MAPPVICFPEVKQCMSFLLGALMLLLLLRSQTAMAAAAAAARLFAAHVLPGLFPYMTLALMLLSRLPRPLSPAALLLLGWGGGSPTGARLLVGYTGRGRARLAVRCATMSPMFLLGTVGAWLQSRAAGVAVLLSVLLSAWLTGFFVREEPPVPTHGAALDSRSLSLGEAVDTAARTMLMVCGTMMLLRTLAALASEAFAARAPGAALALTTLLEVTTGASALAQLPLPLPLRTALIAGATGFGGAAVLMQNRAAYPEGTISLPRQLTFQAAHGALAFLLALGGMTLMSAV